MTNEKALHDGFNQHCAISPKGISILVEEAANRLSAILAKEAPQTAVTERVCSGSMTE